MISCNQHDFIEIACLYHLNIKVELNDGSTKRGVAQTVKYNADKQECLVIGIDVSQVEVLLNELISMMALDKNPHFDSITFKQQ